jgi:hypothetical protein
MSDERILGGGEFVLKILEEAEEEIRNYYTADEKKAKIAEVARNLGVTTSSIFNRLKRKNDEFN